MIDIDKLIEDMQKAFNIALEKLIDMLDEYGGRETDDHIERESDSNERG